LQIGRNYRGTNNNNNNNNNDNNNNKGDNSGSKGVEKMALYLQVYETCLALSI
jgi:hypothetical protein